MFVFLFGIGGEDRGREEMERYPLAESVDRQQTIALIFEGGPGAFRKPSTPQVLGL